MKKFTFEIDDKLHEQVKTKAAKTRKSIRSILIDFLKGWLKNGKV